MTVKKKLIEVAMPLIDISAGGAAEQSIKRGKPTQMHKWFAARPMVTCRAVLWASIVDDPASTPERFPTQADQERERARLLKILTRLADWKQSDDVGLLEEARLEIERSYPNGAPTVVDPFGGGGAIPLEALRLGLHVRAGDLNPVPVLLQRGLLELAHRFRGRPRVAPDHHQLMDSADSLLRIGEDVEWYGEQIRRSLAQRFSDCLPDATHPQLGNRRAVAWIWARTVKSPDPSFDGQVPLVRSWVLSAGGRGGKTWVNPIVDYSNSSVSYQIQSEGEVPEATAPSRGNGRCIATGTAISPDYIKSEAVAGRLGETLIAVVGDGDPGRVFCAPTPRDAEAARTGYPAWLPSGPMSDHPQYMAPPRYGMDDWWKLFTPRQLTVNVALAEAVRDAHAVIESDAVSAGFEDDSMPFDAGGSGARAYADAVCTYLAFVVDRVVDWNNSCCGWDQTNVTNQHLFTRQAIPMMWDFCEINALGEAAGSFGASLRTIRTAIEALPTFKVGEAAVDQMDARALLRGCTNVMISTDPPYYDVVPYADISDFFYMWLKFMLGDIWPDLFATIATPKADELVADSRRYGTKLAAKSAFETGMREFMTALAQAQIEDVPASIFYAYKATEVSRGGEVTSSGWDSFLQSIVDSGLVITSTWPVRTENKSRLRALRSNALASSVVLTCRRRVADAPMATRGEFVAMLRAELPESIRILQSNEIPAVDLAQASIGPGIGIFSRFARVVEADGSSMKVREALSVINEVLTEILAGEEAELDPDSRFAFTWFETYGFNPGEFGVADSLARAKNTTVQGVIDAGIAVARNGQFRLLERFELNSDWDPTSDSRVTVWEVLQHLVRLLNESESSAAALVAQIGGGVSTRARQLAYMLYAVCDRRNLTSESVVLNALVTSWPEILRLAGSVQEVPARDEDRLF